MPTIPPSIILFGTRKTSRANAAIKGPIVKKTSYVKLKEKPLF